MTNQFTPQYEKDFLASHPRASVHDDLDAALDWIVG